MSFDPVMLAICKKSIGFPHVILKSTEVVVGEEVKIAPDDLDAIYQFLNVVDIARKGFIPPLMLTFDAGTKVTTLLSSFSGTMGVSFSGNVMVNDLTLSISIDLKTETILVTVT